MDTLPLELRQKIITHLSLPDLKSIRLVSRIWAQAGEEYLIPPVFTHLPHRPSLQYLIAISQHPVYSQKIRHLKFQHGELNEYHARHNTYFLSFLLEPDERSAVMGKAWEGYTGLKELKERCFEGSCDGEKLRGVFKELMNLESVEVGLMSWPYGKEDGMDVLEGIWKIPSTRGLPRKETVERFRNILSALLDNVGGNKLKKLGHDRLPFEFLTQDTAFLKSLAPIFGCLKTLDLGIDDDEKNEALSLKGSQNLASVLRTASNLETLTLSFQGRTKKNIAPILESFQEDRFTFPHLKTLKLQYIITTSDDLGDFLVRHKDTLKEIQLGGEGVRAPHRAPNGGVHLEEGSWKELFEWLRIEMGECEVWVMGDLVGVERGERWILEGKEREEGLSEYVID